MAFSLVQRLALGTAQFGLDYGINNQSGRPTTAVVESILRAAHEAGIGMLDTAAAYGDSEARLGELLEGQSESFQVVTKVAAGPAEDVSQRIRHSLDRLRRRNIYGILFHSFDGLQQHPTAWQTLVAARQAGLATRIGVSLYHPAQARWLLENIPEVDLVQVPLNVLDQRFIPLLPDLAARGIEVHVRSVFLQGLLLRNLATLPVFFEPLRPKLQALQHLATDANLPFEALPLLFAAQTPGVARVVVGVDSAENLRANAATANHADTAERLRPQLLAMAEPTEEFILPYTWPPTR
ncbi:aldo/keto reductase [Hymenobacter koreensis]|uniref:Aldo/keto reductase n=1 Tax=Hymenobacter koreensis TaxID=1084523 RepID=A0ABP8JC16_9BACT